MFGLRVPIWQAPTGSIAGPELCAAVSRAGGMGAMGLTWTTPELAADWVRQVKAATANPFLVNFALAFPPHALDAVLDMGVPVVTFSWGDPGPLIAKARAAGALCGVQVTNVEGAKRMIGAGADFLICQGVEAGGHVQATRSLWDTVIPVVASAGAVPVIASGGIGNGSDIARALERGAAGAMLGTRFVATQESRAHPDYKQRLVEAEGRDTALTVCFDGGWPQAPHRVLRNSTLEMWEASGCAVSGQRPGEGDIIGQTATGDPILRYEDTAPRVGFSGDIGAMCLYAGTSVSGIDDIPPAADLIVRLWQEAKPAT